jgi:hypothetical protein
MHIFYRSRRAGDHVVHQPVGPPDFCCNDMCCEWGVLVGFGVHGCPETTSREVNIFTYHPQATVWGITQIRYCPWCGEKIQVIGIR